LADHEKEKRSQTSNIQIEYKKKREASSSEQIIQSTTHDLLVLFNVINNFLRHWTGLLQVILEELVRAVSCQATI